MKRLLVAMLLALSSLPAQNATSPSRIAVRIGFGERQDRETDYSGTLSLSQGRVTELIPWRFFGDDALDGVNWMETGDAPCKPRKSA